jgi:hypothetical protein
MEGSPRPKKERAASPRIAPGTAIAILANVNGRSCGIMCLKIIFVSD